MPLALVSPGIKGRRCLRQLPAWSAGSGLQRVEPPCPPSPQPNRPPSPAGRTTRNKDKCWSYLPHAWVDCNRDITPRFKNISVYILISPHSDSDTRGMQMRLRARLFCSSEEQLNRTHFPPKHPTATLEPSFSVHPIFSFCVFRAFPFRRISFN